MKVNIHKNEFLNNIYYCLAKPENVPCDAITKPFMDMTAYLRYVLYVENDKMTSTILTYENIKPLSISPDEVWKFAKHFDYYAIDETGLMELGFGISEENHGMLNLTKRLSKDLLFNFLNMHTLFVTNEVMAYGASVLLGKELQKIADYFDGDLIVFPCSVHEIMVVKQEELMLMDCNEMINSINSDNSVMPNKNIILSDHYYIFDKNKGILINPKENKKNENN